MVEEVKTQSYRKFLVGDTTIFDDICELQKIIQMEAELKQTFYMRFDDMIQNTLRNQVDNLVESQLTFYSDLEYFR